MSLQPKPLACQGCPAAKLGRGFVPPNGPTNAKIALVGQGPGAQEAYSGIPVIGPTGQRLNKWLRKAGIHRHECLVTNVVWCWLPNNRPPTREEVAFCRDAHWGDVLSQLDQLEVVVPVGVPAIQAFLGPTAKAKDAGRVVEVQLD